MDHEMTFREMNFNVFKGNPLPHVLFQPRIEPWYSWHKTFGALPEAYRSLSLTGLFDDLRVSMRYVHYYTGMPDPVVRVFDPEVKIREEISPPNWVRIYETPYGDLTEGLKLTLDEMWRTIDFAAKQPEDMKKLCWLHQHTRFHFSRANFDQGSALVGDRGEPQFWVPKSPYQALAQTWMKFETFIYALADYPVQVEAVMQAIDQSYDPLYEELAADGGVRIVNFGENVHDHLLSPRYLEKYILPFYDERANQLRQVGIFTHVHIDGFFHSLLKYLKDLPFDGLEALTPKPQGDVDLEEIKAHIGDKVLLDGIPAVMFLPTFSRDELMRTVERIVSLFYPRLILGVSDEVPEGAGEEAMTRVRMISEWCRDRHADGKVLSD